MPINRVTAGRSYFYVPNVLDQIDGRTGLKFGDEVTVVNLPGCPRANVMGHCHVEKDGTFAGLVHVNSLMTRADYATYLRNRIQAHEAVTLSRMLGR